MAKKAKKIGRHRQKLKKETIPRPRSNRSKTKDDRPKTVTKAKTKEEVIPPVPKKVIHLPSTTTNHITGDIPVKKRIHNEKGVTPPWLTPFVKGDPRINLKGAPKKIVRLKRLLEETIGIRDTDDVKTSDLGLLIEAIVKKGKKGNVHAVGILLDRIYGKVTAIPEDKPTEKQVIPSIHIYNTAPPLASSEEEVK